jgi:outer membrane lipopolysaccharide assembly protein LptE/RlpB
MARTTANREESGPVTTIIDLGAQASVDAPVPKVRNIPQLLANVDQAIADARGDLLAAQERQAVVQADVREAEQVVRRLERFRADLAGPAA